MPEEIVLSEGDRLRIVVELMKMQTAEMNSKTFYEEAPLDQPGLKDTRRVAWDKNRDQFEGAKHILGVLGFSTIMLDVENLRGKITVI